jgi:hypothetical protein
MCECDLVFASSFLYSVHVPPRGQHGRLQVFASKNDV